MAIKSYSTKMAKVSQNKAPSRQGRQLEKHRAKKVDHLLSHTRRFNKVAAKKEQTALTMQVIRTRMTENMTDSKNRREIVPQIRSWTPQPSPLQSVTTQQEAVEAAEAAALLAEKKAKKPPSMFGYDDDDSSEDDLAAFKAACKKWSARGKDDETVKEVKWRKLKTKQERQEQTLRKILAEKAAKKAKKEACDILCEQAQGVLRELSKVGTRFVKDMVACGLDLSFYFLSSCF